MRDQRYEDALSWVNKTRAEHGHPLLTELPCGEVKDGSRCVIANALPGDPCDKDIDAETIMHFDLWDESIETPDVVAEFINAFDAGEYPELIA